MKPPTPKHGAKTQRNKPMNATLASETGDDDRKVKVYHITGASSLAQAKTYEGLPEHGDELHINGDTFEMRHDAIRAVDGETYFEAEYTYERIS